MKSRYIIIVFMILYSAGITIILHEFRPITFEDHNHAVKKKLGSFHDFDSQNDLNLLGDYMKKQEWNQIYDSGIDGFFNHPLFPDLPVSESLISDFSQICSGINRGVRVYGVITPHSTGSHSFAMFSTHQTRFLIYSLNLTRNKSINHADYLAELDLPSNQPVHRISTKVFLLKNEPYFFQVFYLQKSNKCSFSLRLKNPGEKIYRRIKKRLLSEVEADHRVYVTNKNGDTFKQQQQHATFKLSTLSLPHCDVKISYINTTIINKYDGVNQDYLQEIWVEVFPRDATWDTIEICDDSKPAGYCAGNSALAEEEAFRITDSFMMSVLETFDGDCELKKIVRIERHKDKSTGLSRIFLDLILRQPSVDADVTVSSYLFERSPSDLCEAIGYDWNDKAMVNLIVTVNNQTPWLKYLLASIKKISMATNDVNIRVVVAHFDILNDEVDQILMEADLPHYQSISLRQPFIKSKGIQAGLDLIQQDDSICLLMDLHMEIPHNFFAVIRKHCIEGKMAFNPIVMRLFPGHYPSNPAGYWEINGFGVIAMYKRDWSRIKRLDGMGSKASWGGDDWEIVDYITMEGIEISRFRVAGFYHYYHTHAHLWDGSANYVDDEIKGLSE